MFGIVIPAPYLPLHHCTGASNDQDSALCRGIGMGAEQWLCYQWRHVNVTLKRPRGDGRENLTHLRHLSLRRI